MYAFCKERRRRGACLHGHRASALFGQAALLTLYCLHECRRTILNALMQSMEHVLLVAAFFVTT